MSNVEVSPVNVSSLRTHPEASVVAAEAASVGAAEGERVKVDREASSSNSSAVNSERGPLSDASGLVYVDTVSEYVELPPSATEAGTERERESTTVVVSGSVYVAVPGPAYVVVSIPVKVDGGLVMVALLALLNVCDVVAKSDAVVAGPNIVLPFSEVNDVADGTEKNV
jgi:hypothetical protein